MKHLKEYDEFLFLERFQICSKRLTILNENKDFKIGKTLTGINKCGYQIKELLYIPEPTTIEWAFNKENQEIGDEKMAKFLCKKGIYPELIDENHHICSIGYCEKEEAWYGWSHRAIYGFKVGSKIKKGSIGYRPVDEADWVDSKKNFWTDKYTKSIKYEKRGDKHYLLTEYNNKVPNESLRNAIKERQINPPDYYGKGEWTAKTLDDAKQMAIDFATDIA